MLPDIVYGLWWTSDYAGDVPADELMAADTVRDSSRFEKDGETTYDGVYMATRGSFVVREHRKPKSIAALERKFGERVSFGLSQYGEPGCWIDGNAYRFDGRMGLWTWNAAESSYLWAVHCAREGKSQQEIITGA